MIVVNKFWGENLIKYYHIYTLKNIKIFENTIYRIAVCSYNLL